MVVENPHDVNKKYVDKILFLKRPKINKGPFYN